MDEAFPMIVLSSLGWSGAVLRGVIPEARRSAILHWNHPEPIRISFDRPDVRRVVAPVVVADGGSSSSPASPESRTCMASGRHPAPVHGARFARAAPCRLSEALQEIFRVQVEPSMWWTILPVRLMSTWRAYVSRCCHRWWR